MNLLDRIFLVAPNFIATETNGRESALGAAALDFSTFELDNGEN